MLENSDHLVYFDRSDKLLEVDSPSASTWHYRGAFETFPNSETVFEATDPLLLMNGTGEPLSARKHVSLSLKTNETEVTKLALAIILIQRPEAGGVSRDERFILALDVCHDYPSPELILASIQEAVNDCWPDHTNETIKAARVFKPLSQTKAPEAIETFSVRKSELMDRMKDKLHPYISEGPNGVRWEIPVSTIRNVDLST